MRLTGSALYFRIRQAFRTASVANLRTPETLPNNLRCESPIPTYTKLSTRISIDNRDNYQTSAI
ncbi:hypothetical protein WSK_2001 [Novosphingobium sp. Rr 2-17]|nr:hypothetical protein WSK_2001 [Novosphingobium sp. Rr 2-17]